jgi:hypothetical protein
VPDAVPLPAGEKLVDMLTGRFLISKPSPQVIVWSHDPEGCGIVRAYAMRAGGWRCLAEGRHPRIFEMRVGDLVGDGHDDIVLGLIQRSKLDVRRRPRLYVYDVGSGGIFLPRWRGSGLSRPFRTFSLLPMAHGCDLVAVETDSSVECRGYEWLSVYRWNGFGLRREWTTPVRGSIRNMRAGRDRCGSYIRLTRVYPGARAVRRQELILRPDWNSSAGPDSDPQFVARPIPMNQPSP